MAETTGGPRSRRMTVVDLETTGFCAHRNGITEIGAITLAADGSREEFHTLVNPGHPIPERVTSITGITDEDVANAPSTAQALDAWWQFAGDSVLVAHNAVFDMSFLHAATVASGLVWPKPDCVDTLLWARWTWPRPVVPNHRLGTLAKHVAAAAPPTHRALDDARVIAQVLLALEGAGVRGPLPVVGSYQATPTTIA